MSIYGIKVPPIKCQGIKTKLVPWIKSIVPTDIEGRWIEPFMGSGVVAFNIRPQKALLADSNPHLINFYQAIAQGAITSTITRQFLKQEGEQLLKSKGEYYYSVRERFNKQGDPLDFLFLNRACFNGMIRFNRSGGFNVPFCRKPNRFSQSYITKISNQVQFIADILAIGDYEFQCQDYVETIREANKSDFLYCDPPYIERHTDYFNGWDEEREIQLAKSLESIQSRFILSTWHSNKFRKNHFIDTLWESYNIVTKQHFYHVGAKENNRNPMLEALIMNFSHSAGINISKTSSQLTLFEKKEIYS